MTVRFCSDPRSALLEARREAGVNALSELVTAGTIINKRTRAPMPTPSQIRCFRAPARFKAASPAHIFCSVTLMLRLGGD